MKVLENIFFSNSSVMTWLDITTTSSFGFSYFFFTLECFTHRTLKCFTLNTHNILGLNVSRETLSCVLNCNKKGMFHVKHSSSDYIYEQQDVESI